MARMSYADMRDEIDSLRTALERAEGNAEHFRHEAQNALKDSIEATGVKAGLERRIRELEGENEKLRHAALKLSRKVLVYKGMNDAAQRAVAFYERAEMGEL